MKTTAKLIAIVILLGAGIWLTTEKAQAHRWTHYEVFYQELSPYGTWINSPQYGYVWVPDVSPGFHPYSTSGYWVNTFYGWTWVSFYPWGWAPFHYGRWYYDDWYRWVWVPGNEWGPAWVSWSYYDGYYGWAPLSPGFHFSMTFNMHFDIPSHHWVFVHGRHFGDRHQEHYYMGRRDNDRLYHHSRPITTTSSDNERNTRFFNGPEVKEIRKATGRDFNPVAIREKENAGQTIRNERMEIYRPKVDRTAVRAEKEKPVERYSPARVRNNRSEIPVKYNSEPAERQTLMSKNTRNDNVKPGNERLNRQSTQRQYSDPVKAERRMEPADRKKPETNNGNRQQSQQERRK